MFSLIILLIIVLFIFLFCLYVLAKDDFVLLRDNATLDKVFNIAFSSAFFGLFTSRFFYVIFHYNPKFLNPFVFLLFPYFPGLSLIGGILGIIFFVYFYCKSHKIPQYRMIDIFSLAILCSLLSGFLIASFNIILVAVLAILFIASLRIFQKGIFNDGGLGFFILFSFSLFYLLINLIDRFYQKINFALDDALTIGFIIVSLFLFLKRENLFPKLHRR